MSCRGIRGAISVENNDAQEIEGATFKLLENIISKNDLKFDDIVSIFFTMSPDLDAQFPAVAARKMGMDLVPLLCATEVDVKGSMKKCIRVLIHTNSDKAQSEMRHIYLGEAKKLRPDLS